MNLQLVIKHRVGVRMERLGADERPRFRVLSDHWEAALATLGDLSRTLDKAGVAHFVSDGTLLGLIRDAGFIPGDNDIDVKLPLEALTPDLVATLAGAGFVPFRQIFVQNRLVNVGVSRDSFHIDIAGLYCEDGTAFYDQPMLHSTGCFRNGFLTYGFPHTGRERFAMAGVRLWRPSAPERMLGAFYGPGWRVPVTHWDHFFSPPGLVRATGAPEFLRRVAGRWTEAQGAGDGPPPMPPADPMPPLEIKERRGWRNRIPWF